MENSNKARSSYEVVTFSDLRVSLRRDLRKILLVTFGVGAAVAFWVVREPNLYRASAIIAPAGEENKANPALGFLASFDIPVGAHSKVEDLDALFRSEDLTVRVFTRYNLWPVVFGKKFDPKTGKVRFRLRERFLFGRAVEEVPTEWDAIRMSEKTYRVAVNKKSGTLQIVFESPSSAGSAAAVTHYLEEAKSRLQEEALARSTKNKRFIEEQIAKTVDPLSRERLYAIYGQEVEREMLARNREQFGFKVIDSPRVPDRKSAPDRLWSIAVALLLAAVTGCAVSVFRAKRGGGGKVRTSAPRWNGGGGHRRRNL